MRVFAGIYRTCYRTTCFPFGSFGWLIGSLGVVPGLQSAQSISKTYKTCSKTNLHNSIAKQTTKSIHIKHMKLLTNAKH